MDQILEKLLLANMKGTFEIWEIKIFLPSSFVLRSLSIRRTISPNNGPTKIFFKQNFNIYA